jgi:uncharacterized protein YkwD
MGESNTSNARRLTNVAVLLLVTSLLWVAIPTPARAALDPDSFEKCLLDRANDSRSASGAGPLTMAQDIVPPVREWSEWMRFNEFKHMTHALHQEILPDSATRWGENVAMSGYRDMPDCSRIHDMWMSSLGHRANILNPKYRFVAIGAYVDSSGWWVTQLFFDATEYSTSQSQTSCRGTFCDDDGSTFEPSIERMAAAGITNGCNPPANTNFCPNDYVTRGAMAAFLSRALELPAASDPGFGDDNGSAFEADIARLAAAGITNGCNPPANTNFCPNDYVTRGQMASFLTRGLNLPSGSGVEFADDNRSAFESDIERLAAAGITNGCNPPANTNFCPNDHVTRGQMAAFLDRVLDR